MQEGLSNRHSRQCCIHLVGGQGLQLWPPLFEPLLSCPAHSLLVSVSKGRAEHIIQAGSVLRHWLPSRVYETLSSFDGRAVPAGPPSPVMFRVIKTYPCYPLQGEFSVVEDGNF